jgi:hypothetical protein
MLEQVKPVKLLEGQTWSVSLVGSPDPLEPISIGIDSEADPLPLPVLPTSFKFFD